MADVESFLSGKTASLPNWVWLVVIGGGIAAAYVVPKLFGNTGTSSQTATDSGAGTSGLGLAVDPTTGLPYAVEGLVPSGGTVGSSPTVPAPPPPPPPPSGGGTGGTGGGSGGTGNVMNPLVGNGPLPSSYGISSPKFGQIISIGGTSYVIGPGTGGRIWGVPTSVQGATTLSTWNAIPIGFGSGQKVLISGPPVTLGSGSGGGGTSLMPQEIYPPWPGSNTKQIRLVGGQNGTS